MTFVEYIGFYQLARSEGLVLRYLADTYRALRQTVPDEAKTEELADIEAWLGELVRQVDSSLLDEWEALAAGEGGGDSAPPPLDDVPDAVTRNVRAFRVLVRNALFRRVELAALRRWDLLGELDGEAGWDADAWREALRALLRRVRRHLHGDRHRPRRPRPRPGDDHRGAASAGSSGRSSTTPRATATGRSPPRSTSPRPTRRAWRSSG